VATGALRWLQQMCLGWSNDEDFFFFNRNGIEGLLMLKVGLGSFWQMVPWILLLHLRFV
jgi:hypothetical protein